MSPWRYNWDKAEDERPLTMQSLCKLGCGGKGTVDERRAGKHCTALILVNLCYVWVLCMHACVPCVCGVETCAPNHCATFIPNHWFKLNTVAVCSQSWDSIYIHWCACMQARVGQWSTFPLFCEVGSLAENLLDWLASNPWIFLDLFLGAFRLCGCAANT